MTPDVEDGPRRGRPVDPGVEIALRAAALDVLAEYGWRGTTVERIAEQSGVARTTIYRRYGSVHGVMLMLLEHLWTLTPAPDTGSLRGDLVDTARGAQELWSDPEQLDYLCAMTAAGRENDDVAQALHVRDEEWHAALRPIAERATARGRAAARGRCQPVGRPRVLGDPPPGPEQRRRAARGLRRTRRRRRARRLRPLTPQAFLAAPRSPVHRVISVCSTPMASRILAATKSTSCPMVCGAL